MPPCYRTGTPATARRYAEGGWRVIRMIGVFLACFAGAGSICAHEHPVFTQVLPNGMKVIVLEDHKIPNVGLYLFFRVDLAMKDRGLRASRIFWNT
jgi:hypothetical protein